MNIKRKTVEIKTSEFTEEKSALQRSADFLKAFMLGKHFFLYVVYTEKFLNSMFFNRFITISIHFLKHLFYSNINIKVLI